MSDILTFSRQIYTVFVYFYKCPKTKFFVLYAKRTDKNFVMGLTNFHF